MFVQQDCVIQFSAEEYVIFFLFSVDFSLICRFELTLGISTTHE